MVNSVMYLVKCVTVLLYSIVQMYVTSDVVCGISSMDDIYIWSLYTAKLIWSCTRRPTDWPKIHLVTSCKQTDDVLLLLGNKLLLLSNLIV